MGRGRIWLGRETPPAGGEALAEEGMAGGSSSCGSAVGGHRQRRRRPAAGGGRRRHCGCEKARIWLGRGTPSVGVLARSQEGAACGSNSWGARREGIGRGGCWEGRGSGEIRRGGAPPVEGIGEMGDD